MTTHDRTLLIFGVAALGAAGVSYYRGRRGADLARDTLVHGLVAGSIAAVGLSLVGPNGHYATSNGHEPPKGMGSVGKGAVQLLAQVNTTELYKPLSTSDIEIGLVPENPYYVAQK